jgi:UDP-N-acetylglucosamine 2-epimerase (non-hydrolysing)
MGDEDTTYAFNALMEALNGFPDYKMIITYPNADNGGRKIIDMLETYALSRPGKVLVTRSLGQINYLSALRGARAVIGNSSSGIVEAPAFGVPTVNIGTRQNGRLFAQSILHCSADRASITQAITVAVSEAFFARCKCVLNPYGSGDVAQKITSKLETINLNAHKRFYDLRLSDFVGR